MDKIMYLCNGNREGCKKNTCYTKGGNCHHTSDIRYARNFEQRGMYKNGFFYEKEDVPRNETPSAD